MKYAATYRRWLLDQRAAQDGDYVALGAWAVLNVHCADRELGEGDPPDGDVPVGDARIVGCKGWSERMWLTNASVDRFGVDAAIKAELARWDGDDLLVHGYDLRGQQVAERHRVAGRKGGRPKGSSKDKNQVVTQVVTQMETKRVTKPEPPTLPSPTQPSPTQPIHADKAAFAASASTEPQGLVSAQVQQVFDYHQEKTGLTGTRLTDKKAKLIRTRLKRWSAADLMLAIDGVVATPYYMGANDTETLYNDIPSIFRNDDRVEKHITTARNPKRPKAPQNARGMALTTDKTKLAARIAEQQRRQGANQC